MCLSIPLYGPKDSELIVIIIYLIDFLEGSRYKLNNNSNAAIERRSTLIVDYSLLISNMYFCKIIISCKNKNISVDVGNSYTV